MKRDKNNMMPMNAADYRRAAEHHKQAAKNQWKTFLRTGFFALAALVAVAVLSVAWFANNRDVTSGGMQMEADVSANLVISKDHSDWAFSVELDSNTKKLLPAMHVDGGNENPINLQYIKQTIAIDPVTGLPKSGTVLEYKPVPEETNESIKHYYVDYIVYIASSGKPLTDVPLKASITAPTDDTVIYHQASSVDFYVNGTYVDSLNLKGLDLSNDETYNSSDVKTATIPLVSSIPCCDGDGGSYITVLMRCYFDGALHRDATHTFVTTNDLPTTGLTLGVTFTADEDLD